MGANQSSRAQASSIEQQQRKLSSLQQHPTKKLSSSLRKSVGNVLTSSRLSSSSEKSTPSSNNKCNKKNEILSDNPQQVSRVSITNIGVDTVDSCNLDSPSLVLNQCQQQQQQQQHQKQKQSPADSYYVSPIEYRIGNSFMAAQNGGANNYASQSQLMLAASVMDKQQQQQQQLMNSSIYGKDVPNANYPYHMDPMEMNLVVKRDELFAVQNHHSNNNNNNSSNNNNNIIGRSQKHHSRYSNNHHNHHPATTSASSVPFHLSRAINTKTSSVLNNNSKSIGSSMGKPNASVGAFMASPQKSTFATNSNGLVSSLPATSTAYQIQQQQHQFNLYSAPGNEPTVLEQQYCDDSENQQQYYLNSLLDAPKSQLTPGRRRYKCPKQQYQYLNTSSSPIMPASQQLDFHQYYNKQQATNYCHQEQPQHQQLTLDFRNYNKSYSFGSARTLENSGKKGRAHSKLMSIFQNNNNNRQQYSNTIHLGDKQRRSQLKQLATSAFSNSTDQRSCPGSLKRIKPAPLSAQQASYEAMRTIDMYLIRQIARSCMVS